MRTITCFCENTFEVDVPEKVEIDKDKKIIDRILDGSFLSFTCPKCGRVLKPEFPVRFTDSTGETDILYIPEIERDAYLTGRTSYSARRIVIGYAELQEKFRIIKSKLDDKTIELIKIYLLSKAESDKDIKIYFSRKENDQIFFYIEGLEDDKTAVTHISLSLYNKLKSGVDDNTIDKVFLEALTPPYISANKIQTERD